MEMEMEAEQQFEDPALNESIRLMREYMAQATPEELRNDWAAVEAMYADPPEPLKPQGRHPNRKPFAKRDRNATPSARVLRLRQILAEMPQEEFDERLAKVKAMHIGGPTLTDYFDQQRRWELRKRRHRLHYYCAHWRYKHMLAKYDRYTNSEL